MPESNSGVLAVVRPSYLEGCVGGTRTRKTDVSDPHVNHYMTTQKRLVAQAGIEPTAQAYETRMLPLHYRAASPTVGTIGFEPIQAVLQTAALPLELYSRIMSKYLLSK